MLIYKMQYPEVKAQFFSGRTAAEKELKRQQRYHGVASGFASGSVTEVDLKGKKEVLEYLNANA